MQFNLAANILSQICDNKLKACLANWLIAINTCSLVRLFGLVANSNLAHANKHNYLLVNPFPS